MTTLAKTKQTKINDTASTANESSVPWYDTPEMAARMVADAKIEIDKYLQHPESFLTREESIRYLNKLRRSKKLPPIDL